MQKVSKEYKASMKDSLRERAYIMISFGVVNQEAQAKAKVDSGEFAYFSNPDNLFNEGTDDVVYATLEENFTRLTVPCISPTEQAGSNVLQHRVGRKESGIRRTV